jgi:hypothetical protein
MNDLLARLGKMAADMAEVSGLLEQVGRPEYHAHAQELRGAAGIVLESWMPGIRDDRSRVAKESAA